MESVRNVAAFGEVSLERVRCPSCGEIALRRRFYSHEIELHSKLLRQISCSACDYYLETCEQDGRVLQAYF